MARDVIATTKGARNVLSQLGTLAAPALGAAFTQANGQQFSVRKAHKLALLVYNSSAGNAIVTVKAGVYPPAEDMGKGDYVSAAIPTLSFGLITGLDSSRFQQADGSIWVDTSGGSTGAMWPIEMPA